MERRSSTRKRLFGILDEDSYVFIEMLKEYLTYMFDSISASGNEMVAQLKRLGMREATDAIQKATVVVQALEYLEQNFSSAALGAHSFAGFNNFFLNVPPDMRLFLLSFAYMYSATHDSTANYVIDLNMQFAKLMEKVWQEQTRARFVTFIEAVIHFRSSYDRLQAAPEFKKQIIQLLSHTRWHNDPENCRGATPMMITCQTMTANPTLSPEELLQSLLSFKEMYHQTELSYLARSAKHPVSHGTVDNSFVGALTNRTGPVAAPIRRGPVQSARPRYQRPAAAPRAAAPPATTAQRPQSTQQVAHRNQSNFSSNATAPRGTQQRQRYVNAVSGGASQEHQSYYGQCCAPTTCAYVGLTNARSREPACQRKHAARTFKGTLDDLINFNKSQGWPDIKFSGIEARIKRERDLTRQSRGAGTMHQASAVGRASSSAPPCEEY